jgi:hypothetical protein
MDNSIWHAVLSPGRLVGVAGRGTGLVRSMPSPADPNGTVNAGIDSKTQELGWVIPFAVSCPGEMAFDVVEVEGKKGPHWANGSLAIGLCSCCKARRRDSPRCDLGTPSAGVERHHGHGRPIERALPILLVNDPLQKRLWATRLEEEPMPFNATEPKGSVNGNGRLRVRSTQTGVFGAGMGQRSDSHRAGTKPGSVGPGSFCYEMISVEAQVRAWRLANV